MPEYVISKSSMAIKVLTPSFASWINSLSFIYTEVIRPQRPPAPPTDYFQMNLGGYDPYSLHLAPRANLLPQGGYVGCVRGFKIADHVVDLSRKAQENIDHGGFFFHLLDNNHEKYYP